MSSIFQGKISQNGPKLATFQQTFKMIKINPTPVLEGKGMAVWKQAQMCVVSDQCHTPVRRKYSWAGVYVKKWKI